VPVVGLGLLPELDQAGDLAVAHDREAGRVRVVAEPEVACERAHQAATSGVERIARSAGASPSERAQHHTLAA
jgi:hypothetical protein